MASKCVVLFPIRIVTIFLYTLKLRLLYADSLVTSKLDTVTQNLVVFKEEKKPIEIVASIQGRLLHGLEKSKIIILLFLPLRVLYGMKLHNLYFQMRMLAFIVTRCFPSVAGFTLLPFIF